MLTVIPYPYVGVVQNRYRIGEEAVFQVSYVSSQGMSECVVKVSVANYELYPVGSDYRVYASLWNLRSCQTADQDINYVITLSIGMGIAVFGVCSGLVVICVCSVKLRRYSLLLDRSSRRVHPEPVIASKTEVVPEVTVEIRVAGNT